MCEDFKSNFKLSSNKIRHAIKSAYSIQLITQTERTKFYIETIIFYKRYLYILILTFFHIRLQVHPIIKYRVSRHCN